MSHDQGCVTRFAPSPTGDLHIGGARTALFCWALARREGGVFVLRVEDTDAARSSDASARAIMRDLAWLGIDWDEGPEFAANGRTLGGDPRSIGPFFQSERRALYDAYLRQLLDAGLAYPAFDTPAELAAMRAAAEAEKRTFVYRRPEDAVAGDALARMESDPHVIRLRVPDEAVAIRDEVLGDVEVAAGEIEDFVIRKADGMPTYHFACVVDDELMGVTRVLRGQEHLTNTAKHVCLQTVLRRLDGGARFATPRYAHLPLIFNDSGAKMSKRERDKVVREAVAKAGVDEPPAGTVDRRAFDAWKRDKKRQLGHAELGALADALALDLPEVGVRDFEAAGYLPETIVNFVALLGFTPSKDGGEDRERFDAGFLAGDFELSRVGRSNARFDRKKLLAFSTDDITTMEPGAFAKRLESWCAAFRPDVLDALDADRRALLFGAVQGQSKTLKEAAERCGFALASLDDIAYDDKAVKKWLLKRGAEGLGVLGALRPALAAQDEWSVDALQALCEAQAADTGLGVGMGGVAQPLRVALTGAAVSPGIAQTLAVLGRDEVLARIDRCLATVGAEHTGA